MARTKLICSVAVLALCLPSAASARVPVCGPAQRAARAFGPAAEYENLMWTVKVAHDLLVLRESLLPQADALSSSAAGSLEYLFGPEWKTISLSSDQINALAGAYDSLQTYQFSTDVAERSNAEDNARELLQELAIPLLDAGSSSLGELAQTTGVVAAPAMKAPRYVPRRFFRRRCPCWRRRLRCW